MAEYNEIECSVNAYFCLYNYLEKYKPKAKELKQAIFSQLEITFN